MARRDNSEQPDQNQTQKIKWGETAKHYFIADPYLALLFFIDDFLFVLSGQKLVVQGEPARSPNTPLPAALQLVTALANIVGLALAQRY